MPRISACPNCCRQVSIPENVSPSARVRCPVCQAEFALVVIQEVALPELVLVDEAGGAVSQWASAPDATIETSGAPTETKTAWQAEPRESSLFPTLGDAGAVPPAANGSDVILAEPQRVADAEPAAGEAAPPPAKVAESSHIFGAAYVPPPPAEDAPAGEAGLAAIGGAVADGLLPTTEELAAPAEPSADAAAASDSGATIAVDAASSSGTHAEFKSPGDSGGFGAGAFDFRGTGPTEADQPSGAESVGERVHVRPRLKVEKESNPIISLLGPAVGGFVGLSIAYFILLWTGRDILGFAPSLPRWMVPAKFEAPLDGEPTESSEDLFDKPLDE